MDFFETQCSTATAAGTTGTGTGTKPQLIELEPTVSVALSATTHVYEPVDVIDVDEPVWILRSTTEPTATTQSASYLAHCSILPRRALSATQARGIPPAAHTAPMLSQYLHPSQTQTIVADIHQPPDSSKYEYTCSCIFSSCGIAATNSHTRD